MGEYPKVVWCGGSWELVQSEPAVGAWRIVDRGPEFKVSVSAGGRFKPEKCTGFNGMNEPTWEYVGWQGELVDQLLAYVWDLEDKA